MARDPYYNPEGDVDAAIGVSAYEIKSSVDEFRKSVEKIGESSDRLSKRLLVLNFVLAAATLIGAFATVAIFLKSK